MKHFKIFVHLLFWLTLYLFWVFVFQKRSFAFSRTLTIECCYLIFIAANFYLNTKLLIPRFLYDRRYWIFVILFVGGIVMAALLRVPLAAYLNANYFIPGRPQPPAIALFTNSLVNIFLWVSCLVAGKLLSDRVRFQQYMQKLEKEKSKTELDFLKAQFNPHFLFNSINSIYGHIDKRNAEARNMLLTFSDMLRYQLYECNTDSVSIDKELNYLKNYIALQQARKEESLVVKVNIADNIKGFRVAPLLFVTFIENCFKYVSSNDETENRVEISFAATSGQLLFRTYNTTEKIKGALMDHRGIGIVNIKRRLELLYPGKHHLLITEKEQDHEVILKLELS